MNFISFVYFIFVVGIIAVRVLFHSGKCAKMKQVASAAFYSLDTCGQAPFYLICIYMQRKVHCVSNLLQILNMLTKIGVFIGFYLCKQLTANSSYANWNWYVHWFLMCRYETIKKDADTTIVLMAFTCVNFLYLSARDNARSNNSSSRCLNCRNCQCQGSNPKVQQD